MDLNFECKAIGVENPDWYLGYTRLCMALLS